MKITRHTLKLNVALLALAVLGGCAKPNVYKDEAFSKVSPYFRHVQQSDVQACEAAQLVLLSQGYRIERADPQLVRAQKEFEPKDEVSVTVDFDIVCKAKGSGSTVFANAVQTTYELKKTSGAASLGVAGAGSIAVPFGKTTDALVKVAGHTIADETFYKRFFDLLATYLGK